MKNSFFAKLCLLGLILTLVLSLPQTVYAAETEITEETISEIRSRLDRALQTGATSVELADLNIIVNMYSDRFGAQYQKILDLCDECAKETGSFRLGSHREPYVGISPKVAPADGCNEFGVGPNHLISIGLIYEEYYRRADGSADTELIGAVQEQLTREYQTALSVVSADMNDVEKALALYDYIIAVSNYPDVESIDENGIVRYDEESYSAISVFRDHISVCVANATAYCYLLSDCGIPCIRVDSDEMEHSWTMLFVDGAWYHADPTWDNRKYEGGMTSLGDWNDDIWDLGAASHHYFLKSDEEMLNRLEHHDWFLTKDYSVDHSVDRTPVSGPSGSFDDVFFSDGNLWQEDVHYNYVNGSWFFLNRSRNRIVRTAYGQNMTEAEYLDAPSENAMKYVYSSGDCLFICEQSGIWRCDTRDGRMEKLDLAENRADTGEPVFTEMNIASGYLNGVVVYNYWAETPDPISFSYSTEELLQMQTVSEPEAPVITEPETKPEEEASEPTKEAPGEETAEQKETENSPEEAAGEAAAPQAEHSGIWIAVLLGLAAAAGAAAILVRRRRQK